MEANREGKVYPLKMMPPDVYKILVAEQGRIKGEKMTSQYSLEQTIYKIVREWDRCKTEKEVKK